jgi:hypothetical protein
MGKRFAVNFSGVCWRTVEVGKPYVIELSEYVIEVDVKRVIPILSKGLKALKAVACIMRMPLHCKIPYLILNKYG